MMRDISRDSKIRGLRFDSSSAYLFFVIVCVSETVIHFPMCGCVMIKLDAQDPCVISGCCYIFCFGIVYEKAAFVGDDVVYNMC